MQILKSIIPLFIFFLALSTCAQEPTIETHKLSDNIYMLEGGGGNIGFSVGEDGIFLIDCKYAPLSEKIVDALKAISDKPIKFLVNTHHHGDHTGGNANMTELGATIISHDNVRVHLEKKTLKMKPVITFNDKLNIHINGEKVVVFHLENAHTDGDSMLYFTESNILHTGDIYFNGMYPYIDLGAGGSVNGYIAAVKNSLMLIDDDTQIIPGHGKLSNKKEYLSFLSMLENLKTLVLAEIENGKSEEDVAKNTALTKTYDDLGYSWNFIPSERMRRTLYKNLKE